MALIAIASDKGAPGVTTAALALAAVWPRPVLLAECDPAGGDLVYRFPAAGGGRLDPRRGVLSLAVVARRGMQPQQVWEHVQKLHGGLDVLAGVTNAEQGAGLSLLWGPIGKALASLPQADVIADCGRLGADGPLYDLLAEATTVVLVSKVHVADVIRLRDRATAFAAAAQSRGRRNFGVGVVVVTDHKKFRASLGEVQHVLGQAHAPATVLGGIAHDTKGADLLSGEWGGSLDRTMLIKTARQVAGQLVQGLPPIGDAAPAGPSAPSAPSAKAPRGGRRATGPQPAAPHPASPQPAAAQYNAAQYNAAQHSAAAQHNPPAAPRFTGPQAPAPFAGPPAAGSRFSGDRAGNHAANHTTSHVRNHVAGPATGQAGGYSGAQLAADPGQPRAARHALPPARQDATRQDATRQDGIRSVFTRPPMTPLAPAEAAAATAAAGDHEHPEDAGRGAAPWERPGPSRSGGG